MKLPISQSAACIAQQSGGSEVEGKEREMSKSLKTTEKYFAMIWHCQAPDCFPLKAVSKWAGECMHTCEPLMSYTYWIPRSPPSPQTVSVSGQSPVLCQGCSHVPHGGLPWYWDTLERNSVVVPTESVPSTVCTFHIELHLWRRELTKSILRRGKRKKLNILLSLSFIWFKFQPKVVLCQTIPLFTILQPLRKCWKCTGGEMLH